MEGRIFDWFNWMFGFNDSQCYCEVSLQVGCKREHSDTCDPSKCSMRNTCEIYKLENEEHYRGLRHKK